MPYTSEIIGRSLEGRPISMMRQEGGPDHAYTYFLAGTHGDEVEGVFVLHQLYRWLMQVNDTTPVIIIPVLNPDGLAKGTRGNARGVDLNRNFPTECWAPQASHPKYHPGAFPLSESENQALITVFEKYPVKQVISFHSWNPMLIYNGEKIAPLARFLSTYNHYPIIAETVDNHPTPGSFGSYVPTRYQAPVLTFECPEIDGEYYTLSDIWAKNAAGLQALFTQKWI